MLALHSFFLWIWFNPFECTDFYLFLIFYVLNSHLTLTEVAIFRFDTPLYRHVSHTSQRLFVYDFFCQLNTFIFLLLGVSPGRHPLFEWCIQKIPHIKYQRWRVTTASLIFHLSFISVRDVLNVMQSQGPASTCLQQQRLTKIRYDFSTLSWKSSHRTRTIPLALVHLITSGHTELCCETHL